VGDISDVLGRLRGWAGDSTATLKLAEEPWWRKDKQRGAAAYIRAAIPQRTPAAPRRRCAWNSLLPRRVGLLTARLALAPATLASRWPRALGVTALHRASPHPPYLTTPHWISVLLRAGQRWVRALSTRRLPIHCLWYAAERSGEKRLGAGTRKHYCTSPSCRVHSGGPDEPVAGRTGVIDGEAGGTPTRLT